MVCLCILRLIVGLRMPADTEKQKQRKFLEVSRKNLITMGLIAVYAVNANIKVSHLGLKRS